MQKINIPEEDLKDINAALRARGTAQAIKKNVVGGRLSVGKDVVEKMAVIDNHGRILKHQKSIFIPNKGLTIIGVKGQKFEDIPEDKRRSVVWLESDFIN